MTGMDDIPEDDDDADDLGDDLGELLIGIDEPDLAPPSIRDRLTEAGHRRYHVWLEGQCDLLRRCATFGPMAQAQPR